jgi:hypothetical protein
VGARCSQCNNVHWRVHFKTWIFAQHQPRHGLRVSSQSRYWLCRCPSLALLQMMQIPHQTSASASKPQCSIGLLATRIIETKFYSIKVENGRGLISYRRLLRRAPQSAPSSQMCHQGASHASLVPKSRHAPWSIWRSSASSSAWRCFPRSSSQYLSRAPAKQNENFTTAFFKRSRSRGSVVERERERERERIF